MVVQASELKEAIDIVEQEMNTTMIDYTFVSIIETAIMDVFPYKASETEREGANQ